MDGQLHQVQSQIISHKRDKERGRSKISIVFNKKLYLTLTDIPPPPLPPTMHRTLK